MEYRKIGGSDLTVSALSLGTATFGGGSEFYKAWGATDVAEARRLVDVALDAGVTLFDTADVYSRGLSEEILGQTIQGRRDRMIIATKAGFRMGDADDDIGATRKHLIKACDASLKRLGIETIDLWQLHGFDMLTPLEETLSTLDELVRAGKIRHVGCSNYSGWQLMKSLALAGEHDWPRHIAHQVYYSLVARDFEWELMPLAVDQHVSTIVWSPLSAGLLSGKIARNRPAPEGSRVASLGSRTAIPEEQFYDLIDLLEAIAAAHERPVSQIALNWLLQRPSIASVVVGARNETQLVQNLSASDFQLTSEEMTRLDEASHQHAPYPYWHQRSVYKERNPRLV
ncbi:oxidoreductase (plasmid) [Paraburkholderia sp. PGU19]|uniref:aldo/keto reductase n=1 Tax=Paraburkholderia sp. PGU19 TaxID=2735434 RepID=UPI0015DA4DFF|nr:aldo/keto reductase [Paraburkholderia sp. PGU19]BCG04446.1 oxidoreductase [Paraburkholderia sp. PGU19]